MTAKHLQNAINLRSRRDRNLQIQSANAKCIFENVTNVFDGLKGYRLVIAENS